MEKNVDNIIDSLFSNNLMMINGILGAILIILGIILMATNKKTEYKEKSKRKSTGGIICIGVGILIIASGLVQSFT